MLIEDRSCVALLDSGSNRALVRQDSLPMEVIFCGGTVDVFCIHGDPIAEVAIQVEGQHYLLSVGVFEQLPYQIVLGCDLPSLADLIAKQSCETRVSCIGESLLAVTRSKSKQEQASSTAGWGELPFANAEVPSVEHSRQLKERKSKRQRRQDRVRGTKVAEHVF